LNLSEAREILGPGDPKEAYRRRAKELHPDRGGSNRDMARLNEAYRVLTKTKTDTRSFELFVRTWGAAYGESLMTESRFQTVLKKLLTQDTGAEVLNIHGHGMQAPGWPDLQVFHPKWTGFLELKVTAKPTKLQKARIAKLIRRGTPAFFLQLSGEELILRDSDFTELYRRGWVKDGKKILQWLVDCTRSEAAKLSRSLWIYGLSGGTGGT